MRLSMRVWDLPIRLFHAATTVLIAVLAAAILAPHPAWAGPADHALLALLLWRLLWGFVGSETARWAPFAARPRLAAGPDDSFGHAAAGGVLIPLLLLFMAALAFAGLLPALRRLQPGLLAIVLVLLAAHVLVALAAARGAENPFRAIITGKKRMPAAARAPRLAGAGFAALVLACCAGAVLLAANAFHR